MDIFCQFSCQNALLNSIRDTSTLGLALDKVEPDGHFQSASKSLDPKRICSQWCNASLILEEFRNVVDLIFGMEWDAMGSQSPGDGILNWD